MQYILVLGCLALIATVLCGVAAVDASDRRKIAEQQKRFYDADHRAISVLAQYELTEARKRVGETIEYTARSGRLLKAEIVSVDGWSYVLRRKGHKQGATFRRPAVELNFL